MTEMTANMSDYQINPAVFLARCPPTYGDWRGKGATVAGALRGVWQAMNLDPVNPFQGWLKRGGFAVIKPNWVSHFNGSGGGLECLVAHASLISCIADWCAAAMQGEGRVVIGDCPVQGCNFPALMQATGMLAVAAMLQEKYPRVRFDIEDWRLTIWKPTARKHCDCESGGPQNVCDADVAVHYTEVDVGGGSFLEEIADYADRFRVTMYNPKLLLPHHRPGVHQYLIRKDVLEADLLINLAKMKTHEKAGLTAALKNVVGVNGHKEYLPHHIKGAYFAGGDAYCRDACFARWAEEVYDRQWSSEPQLGRFARWTAEKTHDLLMAANRLVGGDRIHPGSWSGNETIWRMTLDLNELLYFGAKRPKRVLNVIDGVIAGEGEGPLDPLPKAAGVILAGQNPAYLDAVVARLMGYNVSRVPTVYHAINHRRSHFAGPFLAEAPIYLVAEDGAARLVSYGDIETLNFQAPRNWRRAKIAS
jgi:uncharacterized protein (DUF362 family)